jgi:hypothetical protein
VRLGERRQELDRAAGARGLKGKLLGQDRLADAGPADQEDHAALRQTAAQDLVQSGHAGAQARDLIAAQGEHLQANAPRGAAGRSPA